ncbi:MAG: glycosyltransferase family protein [Desulfobulbaceae bacterium]|nr:glycosyltransferase family protein [Desulfobulbaceae bacterium]
MKVVAIIQARMGSTRLPGKVMKLLAGKTVLAHVIERVLACPLLDQVVVATTELEQDDAIVTEAVRCGAAFFRGSETDVLARYYGAARAAEAEIVVRVTSDCPLFDPQVLTAMLKQFLAADAEGGAVDYLSNSLEKSFPRGLDAEVFTFVALEKAFRKATKDYEHEHVTPYLYQHPEEFVLSCYNNKRDLSRYRWTLDTPDDFLLISEIYRRLGGGGGIFSTESVLQLFEQQPELFEINAHVQQKQLGE